MPFIGQQEIIYLGRLQSRPALRLAVYTSVTIERLDVSNALFTRKSQARETCLVSALANKVDETSHSLTQRVKY